MEENKETRKDIHNLSHKDSIDKYQEENAVGKELSASGYVAWQPKPGNFEEQIYSEDAELQTYPLDWLKQGRRNEKAKMQAENLVKAMESVAEVHADWTAESLSKDMELVPGGSNNNKEEKLSKDTKSMKNFPDLNQKQSTNAASYTQIEDPADRMEESPRKNLRWEPENLDNRKEKLISEDVNEQSHDEKNERAPIESLAVLSVVLDKNNEPDTCEDSESEEEVNGVCPSPPHLEKNANETVETPIIDYGLVETAVTEAVATAHTVIDATGGVQVNGETNVNNDVKNVCLSSQRNARNDDIVGMQYDCNDKEEVMKSKLDEYKVTGPNSSIEETTNEEIKRDINITAGVGNKSLNSFHFDPHDDEGNESGAEEEQTAFMEELETFFKVRSMEFKPPKFYGEGLNLLKLWRAVTRLGGYEQVTSCKLWRQVGESFKPPKTCTTVSWTFRCFYEKALLDYEKHKTHGDELPLPDTSSQQPGGGENQSVHSHASGSGRTRRDAAARAMQGWHSQRLLGNGEVGDPIIKDKHSSPPLMKREKQFKSVGLLKRKRPASVENAVKLARVKPKKPQLDTVIVDVGSPADWVKINVRKTKDCFEVYALVPGLLREEVRVQSDPAGRLVISGEPEHVDNPWGVTPFKKVVSLPSRIDPHQTSAVVTLHGQLFVRVPFEQSDL